MRKGVILMVVLFIPLLFASPSLVGTLWVDAQPVPTPLPESTVLCESSPSPLAENATLGAIDGGGSQNHSPAIVSPLNGQIFFVKQGAKCELLVRAGDVDRDDKVNVVRPELPGNVTFRLDVRDPTTWILGWPDTLPSAPYGITFNATDNHSATSKPVNIIVVVEDESETTTPPRLEFGKSHYTPSSVANITVFDFHAGLNFLKPDTITVKVFSTSDRRGVSVNLTETGVFTGEFRGTIGFAEEAEDTSVLRVPAGDTVTANYLNIFDVTKISLADMELDRAQYRLNDTSRITITDVNANSNSGAEDQILANVSSSTDSKGITITLDETGKSTGVFESDDIVFTTGPSNASEQLVQAKIAGTIAVNYKDIVETATIHALADIAFDKPNYTLQNIAEIQVNDVFANRNSVGIDTIFVDVTSSSNPQGIKVKLVETDRNSGEFVNEKYLLFNEDESYEQTPAILAHPDVVTETVTARYGSLVAVATIIPLPEDPLVENSASGVLAPLPEVADRFESPAGASCGTGVSETTSLNKEILVNGGHIGIINCSANGGDTDGDGICNNFEWPTSPTLKITYEGITYDRGTETTIPKYDHKDLYVDIDYSPGYAPPAAAIDTVKTKLGGYAISNPDGYNGVRLHYRIDESIGFTSLQIWSEITGAPNAFNEDVKNPNNGGGFLGTATERGLFSGANEQRYFAAYRNEIHYALFIDTQVQAPDSSGVSELIGNDIIVSLGCFAPITNDELSATFMHELGHNLGLDHGGGTTSFTSGVPTWTPTAQENCKPNYVSIMSYSRQFDTLGLARTIDYQKYGPITPSLDEDGTPSDSNGLDEPIPSMGSSYPGGPKSIYGPPNPGSGEILGLWYVYANGGTENWNDQVDDDVVDLEARRNVNDLDIPGCDSNTYSDSLESFKDISRLILNFKDNANPTHIRSGNETRDNVREPEEMTIETVALIRSGQIVYLDLAIQALPDSAFEEPVIESKKYFQDRLSFCEAKPYCLIQKKSLIPALENLADIRQKMDGNVGGNATDDSIIEVGAKEKILRQVDTISAAYQIALDRPNKAGSFTVSSLVDGQNYSIDGTSQSVTASTPTFRIENGKLGIDLIGYGGLTLEIPRTIGNLTDGQVADVFAISPSEDLLEIGFTELHQDDGLNIVKIDFPEGYTGVIVEHATIIPEFPLIFVIMIAAFVIVVGLTLSTKRSRLFYGKF